MERRNNEPIDAVPLCVVHDRKLPAVEVEVVVEVAVMEASAVVVNEVAVRSTCSTRSSGISSLKWLFEVVVAGEVAVGF
jgi:hypothetical protein